MKEPVGEERCKNTGFFSCFPLTIQNDEDEDGDDDMLVDGKLDASIVVVEADSFHCMLEKE